MTVRGITSTTMTESRHQQLVVLEPSHGITTPTESWFLFTSSCVALEAATATDWSVTMVNNSNNTTEAHNSSNCVVQWIRFGFKQLSTLSGVNLPCTVQKTVTVCERVLGMMLVWIVISMNHSANWWGAGSGCPGALNQISDQNFII